MGTEILHPQDILIERLRFNPPSISPRRKNNPHRKRSPPPPPKSEPSISKKSAATATESKQAKNLTLGKVTILKRGESLDLKTKEENLKKIFSGNENLQKTFSGELQSSSKDYDTSLKKTLSGGDLLLCGPTRLGPDPELVPIRLNDLKPLSVRSDRVYAGSAFDLSPSPRKLPVPKFIKAVDDSATKDLRRLLRLE